EVAEWWRARSLVETRARVSGDRMRVVVQNNGDGELRDAVVRVGIPDTKRALRADTRLLPTSGRAIRLVVPPVPAGATKTLTVFLVDAI
ncbi:MAG TPA: hypothetical protein VIP11_26875, partial [Gemmatimonadaceae bacterium]